VGRLPTVSLSWGAWVGCASGLGTVCPAQPAKIKPPMTQIPIKVFILNIVFLNLRNLFFYVLSTVDKLNEPL
jgi:hypothetical protein